MQELFDLSGKNALVTGATHGLGMAIATGLASAGARLIITGHTPVKLDKAKKKYEEKGVDASFYLFDVTLEEEVKESLARIRDRSGPIDILVNNAGIIKRIPVLEMEPADFSEVLDVNLKGAFIMSRYVAEQMVDTGRGGKIINICSMMSELGRDMLSAYAASKGGLKMLTQNLATELARYNIQVNGIGPGYFITEQTAAIREGGHPLYDFIINRTPAARWGEPEELQGAAIFLASKASDFVNGHILYVDGGILATIGKPADD
jgi:gluconate 5-dehydrogenase